MQNFIKHFDLLFVYFALMNLINADSQKVLKKDFI